MNQNLHFLDIKLVLQRHFWLVTGYFGLFQKPGGKFSFPNLRGPSEEIFEKLYLEQR